LPLSEYSENYIVSLEDITDESYIEEVLSILSNHNMRKRRLAGSLDIFYPNYTMPRSTRILIRLNDANKTYVYIDISHDPRYVYIDKSNLTSEKRDEGRYIIYGDGIDTRKLFELTREF